jgi:uncharacterized protein (DUF433 family)
MSAKLVREMIGGETYEYFPLGRHVVSAPCVCRGRPTFKYTRIAVSGVLDWLGAGHSLGEIVTRYEGKVPREAIQEAATLAANALVRESAAAAGSK